MDELTPPFEEPYAPTIDSDETVEGAAEYNPFDISSWMDVDEYPIGWVGSVKYLRADGAIEVFHVSVNTPYYEAIGMHHQAIRELDQEAEMAMYTHIDGEED